MNARIQRLEALWEECWEERLTLGLQILKLNEKHRTIGSTDKPPDWKDDEADEAWRDYCRAAEDQS